MPRRISLRLHVNVNGDDRTGNVRIVCCTIHFVNRVWNRFGRWSLFFISQVPVFVSAEDTLNHAFQGVLVFCHFVIVNYGENGSLQFLATQSLGQIQTREIHIFIEAILSEGDARPDEHAWW